jgi:hypothetical protein
METDFQRGGIIADFSGYTRKKRIKLYVGERSF